MPLGRYRSYGALADLTRDNRLYRQSLRGRGLPVAQIPWGPPFDRHENALVIICWITGKGETCGSSSHRQGGLPA
jgi:hypothetical protein